MERETLKQGLAVLSLTFPNREFNAKVYWELMKDLDCEDFLRGVKDVCLTTKELFPDTNIVAMIREKIAENDLLGWEEAWNIVLRKVSEHGAYKEPYFGDTCIASAVECVGWRNICLSENIGMERAHFIKAFTNFKNREKVQKQTEGQINHEGKKQIGDLMTAIGNESSDK